MTITDLLPYLGVALLVLAVVLWVVRARRKRYRARPVARREHRRGSVVGTMRAAEVVTPPSRSMPMTAGAPRSDDEAVTPSDHKAPFERERELELERGAGPEVEPEKVGKPAAEREEESEMEQIRRLHAAAFPHPIQAAVAQGPGQTRTPSHLDRQRAADRQRGRDGFGR